MDRHLAEKAIADCFLAFAAEAVAVVEVDKDGVDCGHPGGRCAGKTQSAGEPVGIEPVALRVAIGASAKLGGKILGAPGQAEEPRARTRESAGDK